MPGTSRIVVLACLGVVLAGALLAGLVAGCRRPPSSPTEQAPRIYVADWGNHRLVRMDDLNGRNWTTLGTEGDDEGQFQFPVGVNLLDGQKVASIDDEGRRFIRNRRRFSLKKREFVDL